MSRTIFLITLALALTGCSTIGGMFAGSYTETVAMNPVTGEVLVNPLTRQPIKLRSRVSKEAAQSQATAQSITALAMRQQVQEQAQAPAMTCYSLTAEQALELKADAQAIYFQTAGNCMRDLAMMQSQSALGKALEYALKGDSDVQTVAKYGAQAVGTLAEASVQKLRAVTSFGTNGIIAINARKAIESSNESIRDVGIAAAENGGTTTVGDITVSNSQSSSADSNSGGAAGSGGSAEGGDAVAGSGSGESSNTKDGDDVIINIGDGNNTSLAEDDAIAQAGGVGLQALEPSANGAVNIDSNIDQQPVVDDLNESELNNDPENGSNNSLF